MWKNLGKKFRILCEKIINKIAEKNSEKIVENKFWKKCGKNSQEIVEKNCKETGIYCEKIVEKYLEKCLDEIVEKISGKITA